MLRSTGYGTLTADRVFPQMDRVLWRATEYLLFPHRASWRASEYFRNWIKHFDARQSALSVRRMTILGQDWLLSNRRMTNFGQDWLLSNRRMTNFGQDWLWSNHRMTNFGQDWLLFNRCMTNFGHEWLWSNPRIISARNGYGPIAAWPISARIGYGPTVAWPISARIGYSPTEEWPISAKIGYSKIFSLFRRIVRCFKFASEQIPVLHTYPPSERVCFTGKKSSSTFVRRVMEVEAIFSGRDSSTHAGNPSLFHLSWIQWRLIFPSRANLPNMVSFIFPINPFWEWSP